MKKIFMGVILLLIAISSVSADVIMPGTHGVTINNKITNVNDFQDYIFVVAPSGENVGPGYSMCHITLINENGSIFGGYKFCSISVYAIKKIDINMSIFENGRIIPYNLGINETEINETEIHKIFLSMNPKKVIDNIEHYLYVSDLDTRKEINNTYTIDLNQVKNEPDNTQTTKEKMNYLYIILPAIALILIILFLIKRKKIK